MDNYTVKLTKRAFRDIDGIFQYIASEKLSPENAQKQINRIWEALIHSHTKSVMKDAMEEKDTDN